MFFIRLLIVLFAVSNCYAISVGASVGGGTVFCVSQTADTSSCSTTGSGPYGLIMANVDQNSNPNYGIAWSSTYKTTGAQSLSNGAANTATIIAAHPNGNSSNNAAWACHNYSGGGYTDWYLPSRNELKKMYYYASAHSLIGSGCSGGVIGGAQCLIGGRVETVDGFMTWNARWSSTEYSGSSYDNAWLQDFVNGYDGYDDKANNDYGVRAVRVFNSLSLYPFINSPLSSTIAAGSAFSYTITATNNPTSFSASGLPGGLSLDTTTGVIAGTPTIPGTSTVTINATNALGTGTATLSIIVKALASITISPANSSIEAGKTQQLMATGTYSDNSTQNITTAVTWHSSDSAVVSIDKAGLATALSEGTASITAALEGITSAIQSNIIVMSSEDLGGQCIANSTEPYNLDLILNTKVPMTMRADVPVYAQFTATPTSTTTTNLNRSRFLPNIPAKATNTPLGYMYKFTVNNVFGTWGEDSVLASCDGLDQGLNIMTTGKTIICPVGASFELLINGDGAASNIASIAITKLKTDPIVSAITKTEIENQAVTFTITDFTDRYQDAPEFSLIKAKITTLPNHGVLKLASNIVVLNQEIPADSLGELIYIPDTNWAGADNFSWNGSDGASYATSPANVDITITTPVTAFSISKTGKRDKAVVFSANDFTSKFVDTTNGNLAIVKIVSLPSSGTLQLSNNAVAINQEIPTADLDGLVYIPKVNWSGTDSFNWTGSNGVFYAINAAVNIEVQSNISSKTKIGAIVGGVAGVAAVLGGGITWCHKHVKKLHDNTVKSLPTRNDLIV